ncbi:MAG: hypothetical protein KC414_10750 [Romboutsia sp.]|nr:hypothetical protein [Romboutsia sp.]
MKIKIYFFIVMLYSICVFGNPLAQGEMWIRVSDSNDKLRSNVKITVYNSNWDIVDIAYTASYTVEEDGNAFMYMTNEPVTIPKLFICNSSFKLCCCVLLSNI